MADKHNVKVQTINEERWMRGLPPIPFGDVVPAVIPAELAAQVLDYLNKQWDAAHTTSTVEGR